MIETSEKAALAKMIRDEVARAMNILLNAQTEGATKDTEGINGVFPGMATMPSRPTVYPFGFCSQAPDGTISFVARVGDHPGNRYVIGHRDSRRPDLDRGESAFYSVQNGGLAYLMRCFVDSIKGGKGTTFETMIAGDTLVTLLSSLITELASHTHNITVASTPFTGPTLAPLDAAAFTALKASYLDNGKVLLKDGGRF